MKKNYIISILCMFILLLINILSFKSSENMNMIECIVYMTFGYPEINTASIIHILTMMLPFIIFQIFNGVNIYMTLSEGSIYVFYRYPSRRKWLTKQILIQCILCLLFSALYIFCGILMSFLILNIPVSLDALVLGIWAVFNMGFWLTASTLLMSFLAFIKNSAFALIVVEGLQMLLITALMLFSPLGILDIYQGDFIERNISILKLDPMAHLITSWHSSGNEVINEYLMCNDISISPVLSLILWGTVTIVFAILFIYDIKKRDIVESRRD